MKGSLKHYHRAVSVGDCQNVELNVTALATAKVESIVAAPVRPRVPPIVASPLTATVELKVVAPVTPKVPPKEAALTDIKVDLPRENYT